MAKIASGWLSTRKELGTRIIRKTTRNALFSEFMLLISNYKNSN